MSLVGKPLPAFSLQDDQGSTVTPKEIKGAWTIIYAYPKDNTPGCTSEGQDFRDLHPLFQALDWEVFGISRDSVKSHENFKAKQGFPFDLISDPDEQACAAFAVMKLKNLYGKQVRGIERSTFAIAPDGTLAKAWRGVKVPGHAQEVLEFVRTL